MNRTKLLNIDGSLRAWLDVYSNGKKQICLPSGTPVGFYNPSSKTTHEMSGKLIGYGDLLTSLV
jgi:hypothetical protein